MQHTKSFTHAFIHISHSSISNVSNSFQFEDRTSNSFRHNHSSNLRNRRRYRTMHYAHLSINHQFRELVLHQNSNKNTSVTFIGTNNGHNGNTLHQLTRYAESIDTELLRIVFTLNRATRVLLWIQSRLLVILHG
jgi:hypothetical protein